MGNLLIHESCSWREFPNRRPGSIAKIFFLVPVPWSLKNHTIENPIKKNLKTNKFVMVHEKGL
jgi:hypothetical protein